MDCVNCGKIGHTFRECKEPVMSYGICAVKIEESIPQYLLIRRRDSISYVEFMRGKYSLDNYDYITTLLNGMTYEERYRLLIYSFDMLWDKLWNLQCTRQYKLEYEHAKYIFNTFRDIGDNSGKLLVSYISKIESPWIEPEWGFPKGRKNINETSLQCALREFTEETGIPSRFLIMLPDLLPISEEYIGSNGICYRHLYYIALCKSDTHAKIQPSNSVMNREVGDIGFFTYDKAYAKIRETNAEKRELLTKINDYFVKKIADGGFLL